MQSHFKNYSRHRLMWMFVLSFTFYAWNIKGQFRSLVVNQCKKDSANHIDCLAQGCSNFNALAMEILQSCTKPSIQCPVQNNWNTRKISKISPSPFIGLVRKRHVLSFMTQCRHLSFISTYWYVLRYMHIVLWFIVHMKLVHWLWYWCQYRELPG